MNETNRDELREEGAKKLYQAITGIDESLIEEAVRAEKKGRTAPLKWIAAAAACLCLFAAVGTGIWAGLSRMPAETPMAVGESEGSHSAPEETPPAPAPEEQAEEGVQIWTPDFTGEDYFRNSIGVTPPEKVQYGVMADPNQASPLQKTTTRYFSDQRQELEGSVFPVKKGCQFICSAEYSGGEMETLMARWICSADPPFQTLQERESTIRHCFICVDNIENSYMPMVYNEDGEVETPTTVTLRDGVKITAWGFEDQGLTSNCYLSFPYQGKWVYITSYSERSFDEIAEILDWLWEHPLDLERFSEERGDDYSMCSFAVQPDAFSGYLPDPKEILAQCNSETDVFTEVVSDLDEQTTINLKNGVPVEIMLEYIFRAQEEIWPERTVECMIIGSGASEQRLGLYTMQDEEKAMWDDPPLLSEITREFVEERCQNFGVSGSIVFAWDDYVFKLNRMTETTEIDCVWNMIRALQKKAAEN